jgi:hypothetical protein
MTRTPTIAAPIQIAEIQLGAEVLRIEVKNLNGRAVFSAWRFYRNSAGDLKPGKHGLAFSVERLPEIAAAFSAAIERAQAEGLLRADG